MSAGRILLFAEATAATRQRSGIHRVTVELARHLGDELPTDLVKWNAMEGQLAYFDAADMRALFGRARPDWAEPRLEAHRVNGRFGDTLADGRPGPTWLLFPEIAYHRPRGTETMARIISQCREYGVPTAAIFYDLIPITNGGYADIRPAHVDYTTELSRMDRILSISAHAGDALRAHYLRAPLDGESDRAELDARIRPVLLPEGRPDFVPAPVAGRTTVLLVGTVEPRKRQVEVLEAINRLRADGGAMAGLDVDVVGGLHPAVAARFHAALSRNPRATYHAFLPDADLRRLYERARFTVFASNDEGYGLPIAESLVRGVPCLCAGFGSMAEVAAGGGCETVDVNDPSALDAGLARLAADDDWLETLRAEIETRRFRDWRDYARDILAELATGADAPAGSAVAPSHGAGPSDGLSLASVHADLEVVWRDAGDGDAIAGDRLADPTTGVLARGAGWGGAASGLAALGPDRLAALFDADVAAFATDEAADAALAAARRAGHPGLSPPDVIVAADAGQRAERAAAALRAVARRRARRAAVARDERRYMALSRRFAPEGIRSDPALSLVVSTYNRSAFVAENARWLSEVIAPFEGRVDLTVVDNVSTDDSWAALGRATAGQAHVRLVQNPANTGMLGNLNVCSTLPLARHVWVTGDDDYIVPGAIDDLLPLLDREPGLPLAFMNFGVYHRGALGPGDAAPALIGEAQPLAPSPGPSGLRPVAEIAAEHDNLFTAVYPIVWRSDILAACFNHRFDGVPFADLTESVPTTKILLETYAACPAWWRAEIGIAGNAVNSWSRHRPRWHGLLMPMVFERAREAGVAPDRLRAWADVHRDLYEEALGIARTEGAAVHLDAPDDLAPGGRVFRAPLEVPCDLARWRDPLAAHRPGRAGARP